MHSCSGGKDFAGRALPATLHTLQDYQLHYGADCITMRS